LGHSLSEGAIIFGGLIRRFCCSPRFASTTAAVARLSKAVRWRARSNPFRF
jgi:hypothetical protein